MADPARAAKLAQRIKVVVAEALGRKVKDPRLEGITVTDARVTNDLQHATVYYTVLGDQAVQADAAKGLEKAKGVLRQARCHSQAAGKIQRGSFEDTP